MNLKKAEKLYFSPLHWPASLLRGDVPQNISKRQYVRSYFHDFAKSWSATKVCTP